MKKKLFQIVFIVVSVSTIAGFITSCSGDMEMNSTESDHNEDDPHKHGGNQKTVELNRAQYNNAGIELGWFEKKNLSEVVNANGYTKLPPQNQAEVSVFTSGLVKKINVLEGQEVKKGQVLAVIESPELTILQENYRVSKSNLEYLKLEYDRQLKLSNEQVNAGKVLEKTKSDLDIEQARFNSLEKQLSILRIDGDGNTTSTASVIAPISGHITEIYVNIGSSVESGKTLFSIVDNSDMHVDLLVYEKDLFKVKEGQNVRFVLTNQTNKEINGTIFNVGKSFETETKTVAVHAHIEDEADRLIPGMYVNALIDVGESMVRTVPEQAIVEAEGRTFIFTYEKENKPDSKKLHFSRVEVKTGASQLGYTQVTPVQKIGEGDKIVIAGAYYLQSHLQKSEGGGGHSH